MADQTEMARTATLKKQLIEVCNQGLVEGHPADVLTALQYVTSAMLVYLGIPLGVWSGRIEKTMAEVQERADQLEVTRG